ncbi:hypothetical protein VTN49DRAFT_28 [Thermomyces lanuginosus]|uniref:uncharacterized protein n=1 Tax=Thermomyces lanuginosus TaxID=5541 RepID=UPI00374423F0
MADKRQSVGGKLPTQGGPMVPTDETLAKSIGGRVRITTIGPNATTVEGTLFTACPITNLVAINTSSSSPNTSTNQSGDYRIIPVSRIQSFQLLSLGPSNSETPFTDAVPPLQSLDIRALRQREANAVAKAQEKEARRGKGVTREAQDLFDAFSRTMPTRWDGTSIVVAEAVTIAKPYRVDDCRPLVPGDNAALARVRKVLEMERKKIELRNASAVISNNAHFARQSRDRVAIPNHLDSSAPAPRKGG